MKKYIAKPYMYFDEATEAKLISPQNNKFIYGHFEGYRYGVLKRATCRFDEFEIVEFGDDYDTVPDRL